MIAAPSHSGGCQPASYRERAQVGDLSSEYEPTRARLRNSAAASAIPLRENHCATPAIREMKIAPSLMPNTKRPAHISSYGVPIAVSTAPDEADRGGPQGDARRAIAVDEQPVEQGQEDIGQADDGGEVADLQLREAALAPEQVGDRPDGIGLVVAAEYRHRGKPERHPAQRRAWPAVRSH